MSEKQPEASGPKSAIPAAVANATPNARRRRRSKLGLQIYLMMQAAVQVALWRTQPAQALLAGSPSFLDGGSAITCLRGQPIDLFRHFPTSDPKLNCIQDQTSGSWFGCHCPDGFIRCELNPDCRKYAQQLPSQRPAPTATGKKRPISSSSSRQAQSSERQEPEGDILKISPSDQKICSECDQRTKLADRSGLLMSSSNSIASPATTSSKIDASKAEAKAADIQSSQSSRSSSHSNRRHDHEELDLFLDDMNHNELRQLASGKPLGDLFQVKPAAGSEAVLPETTSSKQAQSSERQESAGGGGNLESSQSEQQIYSECALILQRTYVKNIDDPK